MKPIIDDGEWDRLVSSIFTCEDCSATFQTTRKPKCAEHFIPVSGDLKRHHRFPIIGASGRAKLLVVGRNPRYTDAPGVGRTMFLFISSP
jgi:uracil-DNA glycosylase